MKEEGGKGSDEYDDEHDEDEDEDADEEEHEEYKYEDESKERLQALSRLQGFGGGVAGGDTGGVEH